MAKIIYPVSYNDFKVKIEDEFVPIAGLTSIEINVDGTIETWFELSEKGHQSAAKTAIATSISTEVKYYANDPGCQAIYDTMFSLDPTIVNKEYQWTRSNGSVVTFLAVTNVESFGGETSNVETMNVSFTCIGKPEVVEAPATGA